MSLALNITRTGASLFNEVSHYASNSILVLQNSDKIYLLTSVPLGLSSKGLLIRLDDKSATPISMKEYSRLLFREVKATLTVEL